MIGSLIQTLPEFQLVLLFLCLHLFIRGIVTGYNGTVLAYGQTGSGKTYTMGSAYCVSEVGAVDEVTGVIPRVVHDIFKGIDERKSYEFLVKVSYVEVSEDHLYEYLRVS